MEISLAPDGSLRLHTSARTFLDIPPTAFGAHAIRNILQERSYTSNDQRIGTKAFPTQDQVDKWLKTTGRRLREENEAAELAEKLAKMGLSDLDLAGLDISI